MISFSPVFVNIANVAPTTSGFYRVLFGGIALTFFIFLSGKKFLSISQLGLLFFAPLFFSHLICGFGIVVSYMSVLV